MAEQELKQLQDAKCKCHNGMENLPFLTLMDMCGTFMARPVKQDGIFWERTIMQLMHIHATTCYILYTLHSKVFE